MDFVVDQYFPILEALEEPLVELEEVIFGEKFIQETTSRIYHLKRELPSIKRAVWPLVDVCNHAVGSIKVGTERRLLPRLLIAAPRIRAVLVRKSASYLRSEVFNLLIAHFGNTILRSHKRGGLMFSR
jgi:magnesium transporter